MSRDVTRQPAMRSYEATMTTASDTAVADATMTPDWFSIELTFR